SPSTTPAAGMAAISCSRTWWSRPAGARRSISAKRSGPISTPTSSWPTTGGSRASNSRSRLPPGGVFGPLEHRLPAPDRGRARAGRSKLRPAVDLAMLERADLLLEQSSVGGDQDRVGQHALGVAQAHAGVGGAGGVDREPVAHGDALQELAHCLRIVQGQAEHLHAGIALGAGIAVEFGHFLDAGAAPAGPDVDQQRPADEVAGQLD